MFIPTASEKQLIEFLIENNSRISPSEISQQFPDIKNALEGCLVKGFIERTEDGMCKLTEKGKKAI